MDNIENNMKDLINTLSQGQIEALGSFMVEVNVFLVQMAKATQHNEEQEKTLNDSARTHAMSVEELLERADSCDDEEHALSFKEAAKKHEIIADNRIQDLASERTLINTMPIWQTLDEEFLKLKVSFNSNAPQLVKNLISEVDIIQPVIEANSKCMQFTKSYPETDDMNELKACGKRNKYVFELQQNRKPEKVEVALKTLKRLAKIFKTGLPLLPASTENARKKKKKAGRTIKPETMVVAKKMYELYNEGETTWEDVGKKHGKTKDAARIAAKRYEEWVNKNQY